MESLVEFYAFFIAIKWLLERHTHTHTYTHFRIKLLLHMREKEEKIRWWFTILEPLLWNRFNFTMWWIAVPWKTEIDLGNVHHVRFFSLFLFLFAHPLCIAFSQEIIMTFRYISTHNNNNHFDFSSNKAIFSNKIA